MMDRNLLRAHFQQFGHVVRIYLCLKRKSCTVHFESHLAAALAKQKGTTMKGSLLTIFWSQPAKGRGRSKDHASTSPSDTPAESRIVSEATIKMSRSSESDTLPKQSTGESHPRHRIYNVEKRIRTASSSVPDRNRMRMRHLLHSRKLWT
ncbi:hypothetical protein L798_02558 [Zootermopsis nevadensis]|uniref:RRM domain-containing protein n=2 Tax=Zootermopsis nevadensis TaxID=136037 RepID=A0A067QUD7_ZOONE|nr:hypothetical protein L798_02558 [Zootermopsis nevadensis]